MGERKYVGKKPLPPVTARKVNEGQVRALGRGAGGFYLPYAREVEEEAFDRELGNV
jgi:hypothetical protein